MKTIIEYIGADRQAGEVGIEIEAECENNVLPLRVNGWRVERDGSLRGNAAEYVMAKPAKRHLVKRALKDWEKAMEGRVLEDSGRAGIHVHVNVQDLTPKQLTSFMTLYLIFENALVEWCGASRVGNLFCLRARDAEAVCDMIRDVVARDAWHGLHTDALRYSSMNAKAIATYGSLEFRAMRSTKDINAIQQWVNMLLQLKDVAVAAESPIWLVEQLSIQGVEQFFEWVYERGKWPGLEFRYEDMIDGVRNAQTIAYARTDWDAPVVKMPNYEPRFDVVGDDEADREPMFQIPDPAGEEPRNVGEWFKSQNGRVRYRLMDGDGNDVWVPDSHLRVVASRVKEGRMITKRDKQYLRFFLMHRMPRWVPEYGRPLPEIFRDKVVYEEMDIHYPDFLAQMKIEIKQAAMRPGAIFRQIEQELVGGWRRDEPNEPEEDDEE